MNCLILAIIPIGPSTPSRGAKKGKSCHYSTQRTHRRRRASKENQRPQVRSPLVAQGARSIDERANTVRLQRGADDRGSPCGGGRGGLLGLDELFLGVCGLGAVVGVAEDGAEDCEGGGVVEDRAEGDGGGLDGGEIWGGGC